MMQTFKLWENIPGMCQEEPVVEYYPAIKKLSTTSVVIFPGGAYQFRAPHEGQGYAEFFNTLGMDAFVCQYRVAPHAFPLPLLDARRAVQFVRFNAEKFGVDPQKIGVMGSSAGGHLVATLSNYYEKFDDVLKTTDEIDEVDFIPDFQILCYPVITLGKLGHVGSRNNFLGDRKEDEKWIEKLSAQNNVNQKTPIAFIWHTFEDSGVNVKNSLIYACALKDNSIECELHIFPNGAHGIGLAQNDSSVGQWPRLLKNWLKHYNLI